MLLILDVTSRYVECIRVDFRDPIQFKTFRMSGREWNSKMYGYTEAQKSSLVKFVFEGEL